MTDVQESIYRSSAALIRNEPVQARSTARLAALLDAAAAVVDEIGYERLTTAMVAEHAGASIGTVYRYFPDRIAVLQSLAGRNVDRVGAAAVAAVESGHAETWAGAVRAAFAVFADAFRSEPGFASLRFGDVIDLRPAEGEPINSAVADRVLDALARRYSVNDGDDARFATRAAFEVADALVARAFATNADGDQRFLDAGVETVVSLLGAHLS